MTDLITFSSDAISGRLIGLRGSERMSRPYQYEIFVQTAGEFDLRSAAGARALVTIDRGAVGSVPFFFAGVLSNVQVVHAFEAQVLVQATMVPKLWEAGLSRHSRMFTNMRIPDIIAQVLAENGVTQLELRLIGNYPMEEHVCQYRESDLDFISRWMEKEGIFYWFEHSAAGETLILSDSPSYDVDPVGGVVPYHPQLGHDVSAAPSFRAFGGGQRTLPAQVRLTDYDYMKPNLPIMGMSPVQPTGSGEVSLFGERFFDPGSAERYAKLRAEELRARESVAKGKGNRLHLRPGYVFNVEGHPFGSFNAPWLAIEVRHSANQAAAHAVFREIMGISHEDVYQVEVDSIPAQTQYRAESVTPWPRVNGFEYGVVDAPAGGPYAQVDDQGRYNVRFKFDESSLSGGRASTWVRMMQPHGGDVEGFHFPLRKGTEVVIFFLGGDPDRPVITGIVPNTVQPSPVTSSNNTRNVLQTGGRNRLEFEDQAGSQWMHYSTPSEKTHLFLGASGSEGDHNFILETQGNGLQHTGTDLDLKVDQKWDVKIGDTLSEEVQSDVTEKYHANVTQTVDNKKTITVSSGQEETINSGSTQSISGGFQRTVSGEYTNTLLGPHTQFHSGAHQEVHAGPHQHIHSGPHQHVHTGPLTRMRAGTTAESLFGAVSRIVTGSVSETVTANVDWTVSGNVGMQCTDWKVTSTTAESNQATSFTVNAGSSVTVKAGSATLTMMSGIIHFDNGAGSSVSLVGPMAMVMAGAGVMVNAGAMLQLSSSVIMSSSSGPTNLTAGGDINATAATIHLNG